MNKRSRAASAGRNSGSRPAGRVTGKPLLAAGLAVGLVLALSVWLLPTPNAGAEEIVVYKSPTCGCCSKWVEHLRRAGFQVRSEDRRDLLELKDSLGVRGDLRSCHTALVDGYVVEGHVPAGDIKRLLEERPPVAGLAVPGMPLGSPGMEAGRRDPYEVLSFDKEGRTEVFARH